MNVAQALVVSALSLALLISACGGSGQSDLAPGAADGAQDVSEPPADLGAGGGELELPGAEGEQGPSGSERRGEGARDTLLPCEPPLSLMPEVFYVLPFELAFASPEGGTGEYEFVLTDETIGTMNSDTGAFLAGPNAGVSSRLFVTDQGCSGVAEGRIEVVHQMQIIPSTPQVPPGTSIPFRVEEGSGVLSFELIGDESGATLVGQDYQAGPLQGIDVLRVIDQGTKESRLVYIEVREDAALSPTTWRPQLALGQSLLFSIEGGTGDFTYTLSGDVATYDGTALRGEKAGKGSLEVVDEISGMSLLLPIGVSAPLSSSAERSGDLSDQARMRSYDLDADGYEELILGVGEVDYSAHNSGAVFVYRGIEGGIEVEPARVYASSNKGVQAGAALGLGDFDGDGLVDLAVGVPLADPGVKDGGAVRIYSGVSGELPAETPTSVLGGPFSGDRLGTALAVCDFNGDGVDDLVATAISGENRALLKPFNEQGAIHLYLGRVEEGLPSVADQVIYGHLLSEGELVQRQGSRVGRSATSGDFDGDGACDLAVGTINWSFNEDKPNQEDGGVFLYRGRHAEPGEEGGLEETPSRIWGAGEEGVAASRFGYALAMWDVNSDGYADLVVTEPFYRVPGQSGNRHGAANLFLGEPVANHPPSELVTPTEASWRVFGETNNALFGHQVALRDVGNDGAVEVLVGDPRAVNSEGSRSGGVHAFGVNLDATDSEYEVTRAFGAASQDYFGAAVTTVQGKIAVMASRSDTFGLDVGAPVVMDGEVEVALRFPGIGTGDAYGTSVAFTGDLTGDGLADLVVGVPMEDPAELGSNAGVAMIYRGTAEGVEATPAAVLKGFQTHSAGDRFGTEVLDMGDVDGDGIDDVGVRSPSKGIPGIGAFGETLFNDGACEFGASNVGALYVFRGTADGGPQAEPAFIVYGLKSGSRLASVAGGVDVNNDGRADIIVGNPTYDVPAEPELNDEGELVPVNGQGAIAVYFGQPSAANGTAIVLCSPSAVITGRQNGGRLGQRVSGMGDMDGDGCGDFAASAFGEEYSAEFEGAVHVIRGWGGPGCPDGPRVSVFAPGIEGVRSGASLAGGEDLDGDGVPDLVMGNSTFTSNLQQQGMIWLVSGAHLVAQPTFEASGWSDEDVNALWPLDVPAQNYRRAGATKRAWFGASLALTESADVGSPSLVVVGAPNAALSGVFDGGGAYALSFSPESGFSDVPEMSFSGESFRPLSKLGTSVATGRLGDAQMVVVGGPDSSAANLDNGGAYVMEIAD